MSDLNKRMNHYMQNDPLDIFDSQPAGNSNTEIEQKPENPDHNSLENLLRFAPTEITADVDQEDAVSVDILSVSLTSLIHQGCCMNAVMQKALEMEEMIQDAQEKMGPKVQPIGDAVIMDYVNNFKAHLIRRHQECELVAALFDCEKKRLEFIAQSNLLGEEALALDPFCVMSLANDVMNLSEDLLYAKIEQDVAETRDQDNGN